MNLKNKNYLVIGGSRGIGLEISRRLSENKAEVYAVARSISPQLSDLNITTLGLDITGEEISKLTEFIPDQLHGLVYCPGTITLRPFQSLRMSDFEKDMEVNFYSAIKVLQAVIARLKKSEQGSVVLFSTVATHTGMNFLDRAQIFIVPLRHGSGTRLKILEAFSMAKPVVSTRLGAEGIDARAGREILLGETPQEFAEQVLKLLDDSELRIRLGRAARELAESRYAWPRVQQIVAESYSRIASREARNPRAPNGQASSRDSR